MGFRQALVIARGVIQIPVVGDEPDLGKLRGDHVSAAVPGGVVHYQDLPGKINLGERGAQGDEAGPEQVARVPVDDQDREIHARSSGSFRITPSGWTSRK